MEFHLRFAHALSVGGITDPWGLQYAQNDTHSSMIISGQSSQISEQMVQEKRAETNAPYISGNVHTLQETQILGFQDVQFRQSVHSEKPNSLRQWAKALPRMRVRGR